MQEKPPLLKRHTHAPLTLARTFPFSLSIIFTQVCREEKGDRLPLRLHVHMLWHVWGGLCELGLICSVTPAIQKAAEIMSNRVTLVRFWLSAVLHGQYSYQHCSPPPTPSVNRSHICSCWGLPTITWLPWEHLDPYISVLRACMKHTLRLGGGGVSTVWLFVSLIFP